LWKKAAPEHIMHWPSPWSEGFPGWHLECSTMGTKYLGERFDIHGGGLDLLFPHHECEIAQSVAAQGHETVNYWLHNNMITINGKKMGKSYNNFITLEEFFKGSHPLLEKAYSPMVIRFFILQAHYRSTVDFSNEALQSAEKALQKMNDGYRRLMNLTPGEKKVDLPDFRSQCFEAMNDDLNTPIVIANLFDACKYINQAADGLITLTEEQIEYLKNLFHDFLIEIMGVRIDSDASGEGDMTPYRGAIDLLLEVRANAKSAKDWTTSDLIRDRLAALGFNVKDTKNGVEWSLS
ncbi:MAG: cysteine--tRNA ligase, partial [Muribaculaceae bacterium]|nr:cysteine--tRNA ligase [Muribaculaceae bacterium]